MSRSIAQILADYEDQNRPKETEPNKLAVTRKDINEIAANFNQQLKQVTEQNEADRPEYVKTYRQFLHNRTKYFRDGNEKDEKLLGLPPLSSQQLIPYQPTKNTRPDPRQQAVKLLQYKETYDKSCKESDSSHQAPPFMQKLQQALASRLADHFNTNPKQLRKNIQYYSTVNTVFDRIGVDFFLVLDGKSFNDKEDRFIKFDITDHPSKTNERYSKANPESVIINFPEIAAKNGFGAQESDFLLAMTTSKREKDQSFRNNNAIFQERYKKLVAAIADAVITELERCKTNKASEHKVYTKSQIQQRTKAQSHLRRVA